MCTSSNAAVMARHESERLILTRAHPSLAQPLAEYYLRNRDFLAPFDPIRASAFFTVEGQRALLAEEEAQADGDRGCRFYLSLKDAPGEIIGLVALSNLVRGAFQSCFLGYKLDERLLCRGYMTEAVKAVTQIGFSELELHRIEANIMPRNRPSLRVAEKAGYISEGLAVKYLRINGVWEDHIHMVRRSDM